VRRPLLLLALLSTGCLTARGTADEPVITSLKLVGVRSVDRAELISKLATQASACGFSCDVATLDREALSSDRERIAAYYRERGHYRVEVAEPEVTPDGEGRVRILIAVDEGPGARVTRLEVIGLEEVPEARQALGKPALKVGDLFTEQAFDGQREVLLAALRATGWARAEVAQQARVSSDLERVEVVYTVTPGPRLKFGPTQVSGLVEVPARKVNDQVALEVEPGTWFDDRALLRAQRRVVGLGVFSGVRVVAGAPDPEGREVPVSLSVKEAPFQTLRLGPGIAFQSSRWEAQALATWINRNFLGDLRKLQLDARVGYAWIPEQNLQGPVGKVSATFEQPGAISRQVDLALMLGLERSIEQSYAYWAVRARLATPLRLASRWSLTPSYNVETYLVDAGFNPADGSTPVQLQSCNANRICLLSYFEERIFWDGRDDPVQPRQGMTAGLSLQEGFHIGSNGYDYFRIEPAVTFYLPLGWQTVLAGRIRVGALVPIDETGRASIVALFTSGGANSIRGYGMQRLSPMQYQDGSWVPTGANGVVEASLELRQRIKGALNGVLFLDVGNTSDASGDRKEWLKALDLSALQPTAGLGLRYATPFGPVRVDVGFRLPTDFTPGLAFQDRFPAVPGTSGHHEPLVAFHLTLGEAY
jgi:translocation and assembly module TamA